MRAKAYCAHLSIRNHWTLRCMSRCSDQVVSLKRKPPVFSPQASLVLIYRPTAQPKDRTLDLWRGSAIRYHSAMM
ncbi:hypothetical protein TNCV_4665001 [Trichonephila clavipes]|nr:hypothetical protein TNCV_4665001 [Trichonephila clavipes]